MSGVTATTVPDDPFLWLEEIDGERPLQWVRARNAQSTGLLESDPRYQAIYDDALGMLTADDRIPYVMHENGRVHNFWRDRNHVRGILRRTSLESYQTADPDWETVLDLDALAEAEGSNWVYHGRTWLQPSCERCIIELSPGGSDASVLREFDLATKAFVADGFVLPEAKQSAAWLDRDTLLVATSHGGGPVNTSGYPRTIRRWRRGTPIEAAETVYEAPEDDALLYIAVCQRPDGSRTFVLRFPDFHHQEILLLEADESVRSLAFPEDIDFQGYFRGNILALLRSDWTVGESTFRRGALIAADLVSLLEGATQPDIEIVDEPGDRGSIEGVAMTRDHVLVQKLDCVTGQLVTACPAADGWQRRNVELPANGSLYVAEANSFSSVAMVNYEAFLVPPTLYLLGSDAGLPSAPTPVKSLPARLVAQDYVAEQRFAASADGTAVPYFLLHGKDTPMDGSTPTILYGYGGFEVSLTPSYVGPLAKTWLESGGAWAVANIRGGGEFGPAWHKAALKANRQRAYDDFHAVAEHLVDSGLTRPERLGIHGGSNGGLLVGVAFTQRPDLYGAVVCAVPLLDMLRYHKLLAGASWIGEYGNPDIAEERAWIERYSPYQNVEAGGRYPPVFFCTSTKDDRVHPGHARKMAARMLEQGHEVLYFENVEGGHGAAANLEQMAQRAALTAVFFERVLADGVTGAEALDVT